MGTLDIGPGVANNNRHFYRNPTGSFGITTPIKGDTTCEGPPGWRDGGVGKLYLAYRRCDCWA